MHQKHIKLVELVNNSKTIEQHRFNENYLDGWRQGVKDSGITLSLLDCDIYYLDQGIERPMCAGVWLDWEETK